MGCIYTKGSQCIETVYLKNASTSTNELNFQGKTKWCKVVSVYDGDTIRVVFRFYNGLYKFNCRLEGIDTPELRTKNMEEKKAGYVARDKLREKILNKVIQIKCNKFDKYGRLLITPFYNHINICEWLINNQYAVPYDGGTKTKFKSK